MDTVKDKIGKEYEDWGKTSRNIYTNVIDGNDNCIFISSPTGSGKTYFILNVLLPYVSSKGMKLLYLVNRKILKEQIEKEFNDMLNDMPYVEGCNVKGNIKIETYQAIELEICKMERNGESDSAYLLDKYKDYDYVVCDECHYFLADSNFNTNTILSFRFVQEQFADKIRIFMSATINDIKSVIMKDNERREKLYDEEGYHATMEKYDSTYHYGILYDCHEKAMYLKAVSNMMESGKTQFDYTLERDYSYINNINILVGREQIVDVIKKKENSGKWFIFVDSIKFGNKLKKELEKEARYTVVMIKAEYKDDENAIEVVDEIIEKGTIEKADIIISTSVMDNGINLKDKELNHFVLLADTEVEFIQMLGRKRKDNRPLDLYIIGQNKNFFERRKRWVEKRLRIAVEYLDCLKGTVEEQNKGAMTESDELFSQDKYKRLEIEMQIKNADWEDKYSPDIDVAIAKFSKEKRNKKNEQEQELIEEQHMKIMSRLFNKPINYVYAKNIYNVYKGKLYLNLLSFLNLENLNQYYKRIIKEFDSVGEDAFIKEQLGWLGIQGNEADEIIGKAKKSEEDRAREVVIKAITRLIESSEQDEQDNQNEQFKQPLTKEEAIDFLNSIKNELLILLKNTNIPDDNDKIKYTEAIKKNDRLITKPMMEYLRKYCNLPFKVDTKEQHWTFVRYEGDEN